MDYKTSSGYPEDDRCYLGPVVARWAVGSGKVTGKYTEEPAVIVKVSAGTEEVAVEEAMCSSEADWSARTNVLPAGTEEVAVEEAMCSSEADWSAGTKVLSAGTEEVAVEIAISSNGSKAVMSAGTEEVTPETRRVWFKFAAVPEEVTPETRTVSVELVGTEA